MRTLELTEDEWVMVGLLVSHAAANRVAIFAMDNDSVTRIEAPGLDILDVVLRKMEELD